MFGPCRLPFSSAYINYEAWFRNGALKADLLGKVSNLTANYKIILYETC